MDAHTFTLATLSIIRNTCWQSKFQSLNGHPRFKLVQARTPEDMLNSAKEYFPSSDTYISAAAIGDIVFKHSQSKLKKESLGDSIPISQGPDVF